MCLEPLLEMRGRTAIEGTLSSAHVPMRPVGADFAAPTTPGFGAPTGAKQPGRAYCHYRSPHRHLTNHLATPSYPADTY